MEIRRFRAVVSVVLSLALAMPSVAVVPSAGAQQAQGFAAPPVPGMPQGLGTQMPGFPTDYWLGSPQYPNAPSPPPQPAPTPLPTEYGQRPAPLAPGLCSSQTYQTLAVPRGPEVRNVATKMTLSSAGGEKPSGEGKLETIARPDLDALSPIWRKRSLTRHGRPSALPTRSSLTFRSERLPRSDT
jgi:hypothetical protein